MIVVNVPKLAETHHGTLMILMGFSFPEVTFPKMAPDSSLFLRVYTVLGTDFSDVAKKRFPNGFLAFRKGLGARLDDPSTPGPLI